MAKNSNRRGVSLTVLFSYLSVLSLAFFIKSLDVLFNDWFASNALLISIVSGFAILFFIIIGMISLRKIKSRGAGIVTG